MGWDGIYVNLKSMKEIKAFLEKETGCKIVKHGYGTSYGVYNNDKVKNLLVVILWKNSKGELSYKDMDESMYPYYFDFPIKYLDLPAIGFSSNETYRNECQFFQYKKNRLKTMIENIKAGDVVKTEQEEYLVIKTGDRIVARSKSDNVYWIKPKTITNINNLLPNTQEEFTNLMKAQKIEKILA